MELDFLLNIWLCLGKVVFLQNKSLKKMCTLNVRIDDKVMARVKPYFTGDHAMHLWIEDVLKQAMEDFAQELESQAAKEAESRKLLERLESLKNDPDGFFKMGGILGQLKGNNSWKQLREEAMFEKYGV